MSIKHELSFRLTQILTGHGVFGSHLARIGKEKTTESWFCNALENDACHTLLECPRWALFRLLGDPTIMGLVEGLHCGLREWSEISRFAETVTQRKENREREGEILGIRRLQSGKGR